MLNFWCIVKKTLLMGQKIKTLLDETISVFLSQFPSSKENFFVKEYEISGQMRALKELLEKELSKAAKDKQTIVIISKHRTLWSNLYYLLNQTGIGLHTLRFTKEITVDFSTLKLTSADLQQH